MDKIKNLSIVVPNYNEESRVLPTIEKLKAYLKENVENFEVIFVDDGSKDNTAEVIEKAIADWPDASLIKQPENYGKGAAVQAGVMKATKENVCFMDADCSTDLEMLRRLNDELSDEHPVIIGSRDIKGAEIGTHQSWLREHSAKLFNLWIQLWLLPGVWDTQCGFKLFKTNVAKKIFENLVEKRFGFDVEILFKAKKNNFKIKEVPVKWTNVLNSRVNPIRDGMSMAWQVMTLRWKI